MSIYCVQQNLVSSVWDSVEQYLSDGIKDCDAEYTLPQLKNFLTSGKWKLFVAISDKDEVHGAGQRSLGIEVSLSCGRGLQVSGHAGLGLGHA